MSYGTILARLRKSNKFTQAEAAEFISRNSGKACSSKVISHWENDVSSPSVKQFLLLCEYYGVEDIQHTFRNAATQLAGKSHTPDIFSKPYSFDKLNELGKSRALEYISMLSANPLFSEIKSGNNSKPVRRFIKLYDIPVAAGTGVFLDSDHFTELEADDNVPTDADFAVKVSGDSMEPRFADGEVIYVKKQNTLEVGEIGIVALNGDSYVKQIGHGKLLSLNPLYDPITIGEFDSFFVFGKVISSSLH